MPKPQAKARQAHKLATHYLHTGTESSTLISTIPSSLEKTNRVLETLFSHISAQMGGILHTATHYGHSVGDMEASLSTFSSLVVQVQVQLDSILDTLTNTPLPPHAVLPDTLPPHTPQDVPRNLYDFVDADSVALLRANLDAQVLHLRRLHAFLTQNLRVIQALHISAVRALEDSYSAWSASYAQDVIPALKAAQSELVQNQAVLDSGFAVVDQYLQSLSSSSSSSSSEVPTTDPATISSTVLAMYEAHNKLNATSTSLNTHLDTQAAVLKTGLELAAKLVDFEPELVSKVALLDNIEYQFADGLEDLLGTYSELHHLAEWYTQFADAFHHLQAEKERRLASQATVEEYVASVNAQLSLLHQQEHQARADFYALHGKYLPSALYSLDDARPPPPYSVVQSQSLLLSQPQSQPQSQSQPLSQPQE